MQVDGQTACVDKGPPETKYPACNYENVAALLGGGGGGVDGGRVSRDVGKGKLRGGAHPAKPTNGKPEINVFFASV